MRFVSAESAAELGALARELEQEAVRYPDERGEILLEAADKWEQAGHVDQAVALLREVLTIGGKDAGYARYSLAEISFKQGADSEAREHLQALEEMEPVEAGPTELVGELLAERGEYEAALRWFDRAIEAMDVKHTVRPGSGPSLAVIPLVSRRQCRAELGLPPDELDRIADVAEDNRREFAERLKRLDRLASDRTVRTARLPGVRMLVWPRAELHLAAQRWPEVFAADVVSYHADIERRLRELAQEQQSPRIHLILGAADGFAGHLNRTGGDPADESVRLAYAQEAVEQGRMSSWPPGRNEPCWCGSGRKYKKCCGAPSPGR